MKIHLIRFTAKVMLIVMALQLVLPATSSFALTTGPSQPEVQSFEPVGTTDMVDLFSGDFVYNIPLMDVEGYPINISYHSGINMEQEASWVGLGWNINPGEINRNVRGLPDDFNGEKVNKILKIKEETEFRFKGSMELKPELFGAESLVNLGATVSAGMSNNNYKGMSAILDVNVGASLKFPYCSPQIGMGVSVGSQEGASIEGSLGVTFGTNAKISESTGTLSLSGSTGFNTRSGLRNIGLTTTLGVMAKQDGKPAAQGLSSISTYIPIGLQNYVPVITNASTVTSSSAGIKIGPEGFGIFAGFGATIYSSVLTYLPDGSRNAYGYLYMQNADEKSIVDFSREKDGMYNETMPNLPLSSMTYDVYSISGQGGGGMCRPFRNDIGSVFDPFTENPPSTNTGFFVEGGAGGAYEFGGNYSTYENNIRSGPWFRKLFSKKGINNMFENVYFKQAGEMTYNMVQDDPNISTHAPFIVDAAGKLVAKGGTNLNVLAPSTFGSSNNGNRTTRASLLSFLTNSECAIANPNVSGLPEISSMSKIEDYHSASFTSTDAGSFGTNCMQLTRPTQVTTPDKAKGYHIGEMTQTLPDGRRYVYAIPAMNNVQKEVTFAVDNAQADISGGLVGFSAADDSRANGQGTDNYYQATYTPAYAHSYLLTSVLSPDYMDITGDGLSEDDLGSYTKINYSRTDADFRWIAPIQAAGTEFGASNKAQYNPGFWSDLKDDKGNYIIGSKEMWYMHSIESKNMVAEFYISARKDGMGVRKSIVNANATTGDNGNVGLPATFAADKPQASLSLSYKLDSIKLFSKHDRILNPGTAVPIKTVMFQYDYSSCQGVPNFNGTGSGKLTLKHIYFRYGNSEKSLMNPYEFEYNSPNPTYNFALKDRWGNYKPADADITNYEFPYVKQDKTEADNNAKSWHLTGIKLPSGGHLAIDYEADDYSYVQDKRAMEMFRIEGVGAGKDYNPKDVLYENTDNQYQYIYFKRADAARELSGKSFRERYFGDEKTVYFSFDVDVANRNRYEHITGYADIDDEGNDAVGECSDGVHGYIRVKLEKAGGKGNLPLNPVTLASLNKGRYYLPHLMYKGYNPGGALDVMKAMLAAAGELFTIGEDANKRFVEQKLSKKFIPKKSWVRLTSPSYTKIGGGTRVKSLRVLDNWAGMTTNTGTDAEYGQQYFYKTLLDNGQEISSGVASYEPLIGADEIPQRRPANKYTADGGRLLPAIEFNQEEPFGESFYPGASVGYSKVTVASIHVDKARSAQALNVHEFYTARDFPIQTDFTEKNTPVKTHESGAASRFDEINVLQGYALIMNDMHGKPKAVTNYVIKTDQGIRSTLTSFATINAAPKELVTSTKYNYQTQNGRLYNKVKAVRRDKLVQPIYSVQDMVLGEETDFTIDNRMRDMDSKSMNISANLNVIGLGIFVIPIPTVFFPDSHERNVFKTMVATKVIQQYGILKSVETIDHGARVVSENVLYDSETGQPLLTTINNEYNDPISNANIPAYWAYDNMGGAYFNMGYEEIIDSVYIDAAGKGYLIGADNKRNFNIGDELLIELGTAKHRVWITDMKPVPCPCGEAPPLQSSTQVGFGNPSVPQGCRKNGNEDPKWWKYDGGSINTSYYWDGTNWISVANSNIVSSMTEVDPCLPPPSCPTNAVPVIEPRAKYLNGNSATKWTMFRQGYNKVYVKVLRSGRRNQLGNSIENIAVKGAISPVSYSNFMSLFIGTGGPSGNTIPNVLSASVNTYTESASANEFTAAAPWGFNDYILGKRGNFRDYESYTWLADRNYGSSHNRVNGTYNITRFWAQGNDITPCSLNDINVLQSTSGSPLWRLLKRVTQYSAYGLPLEEQNASGIYSTAVYGYNHALPVAVGSNIRNGRLKYFNFEDLTLLNSVNERTLGIPEILTPNGTCFIRNYHNPTGSSYNYISYVPDMDNFGSGMVIDNTDSHTGKYALRFNNPGVIKLANVHDYETSGINKNCYISLWVKPLSGVFTNTSLFLRGYGKSTNPTASADFNAFTIKTGSIDGWYKIEGKIDMSLLNDYNELRLVVPAVYCVDDIRLYPDNGNMKSFAYDMTNMRLMAELDENNFATFYEYDQEGVLIRVKKESDRGILTVSENRKANAK